MKNKRRKKKKKRSAENTLPENALKNNENIDIRGNHDALSRRILPCQTPIENVAPSVSRSRGAFSARFFGRVLSKQTPMSRAPTLSTNFLLFFSSFLPFSFSLLFWRRKEEEGRPPPSFFSSWPARVTTRGRVDSSTASRFFTRRTIHRQIFLYNCSRRRDVGKQNTDAVQRSRNDEGRGRGGWPEARDTFFPPILARFSHDILFPLRKEYYYSFLSISLLRNPSMRIIKNIF